MDNDALSKLRNQLLNLLEDADAGISSRKLEQALGPSQLLFIGKFGIYIYQPQAGNIEFFSKSAAQLLGYPESPAKVEWLQSLAHPDDQESVVQHKEKTMRFFQSLNCEECLKFKAGFDFRIRRANGSYIRVYKQSIPLSCDKDGSIERMLVILTDISEIKSSTTCRMSVSGLNGQAVPEPFHKASAKQALQSFNLSRRELEVLQLIANNCNSEGISKILLISPHTVKVHRKNLLKKTQCKNALELVMKAKENGWV